MAFSYHPPTRSKCEICEHLLQAYATTPIIGTFDGRASSANGYPFHDWYNFVLGYTPTFPEYILDREGIRKGDGKVVLDPFNGSGTTQLVCKLREIPSYGVDANDFMVFAAKQKLNWKVDTIQLEKCKTEILKQFNDKFAEISWEDQDQLKRMADEHRPPALDERYISDKPLIKIALLKEIVKSIPQDDLRDIFLFAISAILVTVSNVKYGPGFGVGKIKEDADVLKEFKNKAELMIHDLKSVSDQQRQVESITILGDSRKLTKYVPENSVSLMITSPPYPGDHEYTKHSKLELISQGYATDVASFRVIKKRMIRGSTTNIYREDNERRQVENITEIQKVTAEIESRLKKDGATSGFEKLYTKLVWEYFGGMSSALSECYKVLKPGGKIALLVSDSHAFKMVHIQTAQLLKLVGEQIGYENAEVILWQMKNSTSHKYQLRENILFLQKPEE
mgnify:FL=1